MIDRMFEKIADALGTNTAIVVFTAIAVVPLFFQLPHTVIEWQNWLSQTCIQLIALAVLQKGTKVEGARQSTIIRETHDATLSELSEIKDMHRDQHAEMQLLKQLCAGCAYNEGSEQ